MGSADPTPVDLLVVGPAGHPTGGIARYIDEQRARMTANVSTRVHDTATPRGTGLVWFVTALVRALIDLLEFPFRRPPDVVHVHTSHQLSFYLSACYVLFASYVWRRPVVVHVHGSSFDDFVENASVPLSLFQRVTLSAADAVIALSTYWRETLARVVPEEKLVVLPNAVDVTEYDPSFDPTPPKLVFVSNHIERKGLPEFVEAVRTTTERHDGDVQVSLAGSGPLSHLAEDLADELPAVDYHGYVEEAEKRRLVSEASIYVLPTHAEGLPIALLEGMAGGNAVVSTDVGGIPDLLGPDNGIVVQPGEVDQLAEALAHLVSDPDTVRDMARLNRALVEDRYSWESVVEELTELYTELCEDDRTTGRRRSDGLPAG